MSRTETTMSRSETWVSRCETNETNLSCIRDRDCACETKSPPKLAITTNKLMLSAIYLSAIYNTTPWFDKQGADIQADMQMKADSLLLAVGMDVDVVVEVVEPEGLADRQLTADKEEDVARVLDVLCLRKSPASH